jgi:hypothetical protein
VISGGSTGTIVKQTKFHFVMQPWGDEEVTQIVADPQGAALTTTYTYFTSISAPGNFGRVQSVTDPTGSWRSYLYYDDWNRLGQVEIESRPFNGSPATWQAAATNVGKSVFFNYTADYSGLWTIPVTQASYTNGVMSGQEIATAAAAQSLNGMSFTSYQTNAYSSASVSQQSNREVTDPINSVADYNNLPLLVQRADQSQDSYAYYIGTFTPANPSPPNSLTNPPFTVASSGTLYFRTNAWHGSSNSSVGDSLSSWA